MHSPIIKLEFITHESATWYIVIILTGLLLYCILSICSLYLGLCWLYAYYGNAVRFSAIRLSSAASMS